MSKTYTEKYTISQHDYNMVIVKLCDIKSMLFCNENPAFIENSVDDLMKMLRAAIQSEKQK